MPKRKLLNATGEVPGGKLHASDSEKAVEMHPRRVVAIVLFFAVANILGGALIVVGLLSSVEEGRRPFLFVGIAIVAIAMLVRRLSYRTGFGPFARSEKRPVGRVNSLIRRVTFWSVLAIGLFLFLTAAMSQQPGPAVLGGALLMFAFAVL